MTRLRINVDVDGVLAYPLSDLGLTPEEVTHYDFTAQHPAIQDYIFKYKFSEPDYWANLPVLPGAWAAITTLAQEHDVLYCTAPWKGMHGWLDHRREWLVKHSFPNAEKNLIVTSRKDAIWGDVFIDDKLQNLQDVQKAGRTPHVIRFGTYKYSDAWDGVWCQDWVDVLGYLRKEVR